MYSPYELETIAEVLASLHATVDPEPEGKTIEGIDVVPLEVFEQARPSAALCSTCSRDDAPLGRAPRDAPARGRPLQPGPLRRHAAQPPPSRPALRRPGRRDARKRRGAVRVVVITKDVWSLRLNWDVVVNAGGLEQLYAAALRVQRGWHPPQRQRDVHPGAVHVHAGPRLHDPAPGRDARRAARRTRTSSSTARAAPRRGRTASSSSGSLSIRGWPIGRGLPSVGWQDYIARQYVNAAPSLYRDPATGLTMPFAYRSRGFGALYEVTRSIGWEVKHDVSFGASVNHSLYYAAFPSADARTRPTSRRRTCPRATTPSARRSPYHTYTKRYVRLIDFETLGLQEDAVARARDRLQRPAQLQGPRRLVRRPPLLRGGAVLVGLARRLLSRRFRLDDDLESDHIGNAAITPAARLVTPTLAGLGRLVVDGLMLNRWRDELNIKGACEGTHTQDADTSLVYAPFAPCTSFIGGSDRLRGFPTNLLVDSKDFVAYDCRAPVAPGRAPLAPARRNPLLRRGWSRPRARQLPHLPVRRGRVSRHLPLARSRGLSRGYRLPARASARPEHGSARASVRLPHLLRPGFRRAERVGQLRPADRTSLMVNA